MSESNVFTLKYGNPGVVLFPIPAFKARCKIVQGLCRTLLEERAWIDFRDAPTIWGKRIDRPSLAGLWRLEGCYKR